MPPNAFAGRPASRRYQQWLPAAAWDGEDALGGGLATLKDREFLASEVPSNFGYTN